MEGPVHGDSEGDSSKGMSGPQPGISSPKRMMVNRCSETFERGTQTQNKIRS